MQGLQEKIPTQKSLVYTIAVAIFSIHLVLALKYSYPYINNNSVNVIIEYLRSLYFDTGFYPWKHQINYYTGNPFFLLPFFLFLEPSPFSLRLLLIVCMAGASMFAFLSYVNIHGFKNGVIGALVLLNMNTWILFRDGDYTYSALFPMICLFLYTEWEKSDTDRSLYALSFLTGFFFYFKAVLAYFAISMSAGKILDTKGNILSELGIKKILGSILLLLTGALFFLINGVKRDFIFLPKALGIKESGGYNEGLTLLDIAKTRLTNFTHIIDPGNLIEIPNCTGCWSLNTFLILLVMGLVISVYRRRNLDYSFAFLTFFVLLFHVPHDIRWMQLPALMPFVPLIILNIVSEFGEYRRYIQYGAVILLLIGLFSSINSLQDYSRDFNEPTHWGGTQEAYVEYKSLNVSGESVATNSYYIWVLSRYDFSTEESTLLIRENSSQIREGWTNFANKGRTNLDSIRNIPDKLLLRENPKCQTDTDSCGYNSSEVLNSLNIDNYSSQEKYVHGEKLQVINPEGN